MIQIQLTYILQIIKEVLPMLPGILLTTFSLYFAWQKIGYKITVSLTCGFNKTTAMSIKQVILVNHKNRVVPISEIYAVINGKQLVIIETFDVPLLLKPLEAIAITPHDFSFYVMNGKIIEIDFMTVSAVHFFASSENKTIQLIEKSVRYCYSSKNFKKYEFIRKVTNTYNNKVYSENIKYGVTYQYNEECHTAFIDDHGFIWGDWIFDANKLSLQQIESADDVEKILSGSSFGKYIQNMHIEPLNQQLQGLKDAKENST
jgi:hypothetical protein